MYDVSKRVRALYGVFENVLVLYSIWCIKKCVDTFGMCFVKPNVYSQKVEPFCATANGLVPASFFAADEGASRPSSPLSPLHQPLDAAPVARLVSV